MEPAFFLIAILGCGEGDAPCEQVRRLDSRFESRAACARATDRALAANADQNYPVVVAQCVAAGEPAGQVRPVDVRLPEPTMKPRRAASATRSG
jgi:hypothetical protein